MREGKQKRHARHVQPSGRPSGAPSRLDVATPLCEPDETANSAVNKHQFQTPDHNLDSAKSGPVFGVHLTTGVLGSDSERSKNWYNLIRCAGSSSKNAGEGGSFGIGKNAPFAASLLRTVLYSTFNVNDEHIFQGVATLVSHQHPKGGIAQPTGYLGGGDGASVRVKSKIPKKFLRSEHGTDLIVLGFRKTDKWNKDLIYSILDNFWPAIHFGDLEVEVDGMLINSERLQSLLEQYSAEEDFTAHLFYQAFTKPKQKFPICLPRLGDVTLYLLAENQELPKRIAMVRKTGMKIFEKNFRSMIPFCGVFLCRNDAGNMLLREMEPPRHDTWDADHPDKGANRRVESEYVNFIRDCIRKLTPVDESKVISISGLNRFLPDDDETPEESFDGDNGNDTCKESAQRRQLPEKIPGRKLNVKVKTTQPDHQKPEGEADHDGQSGDEENVETSGHGGGDGQRGRNSKFGGSGGTHGGSGPRLAIPIRYRTFAQDYATGVYTATVSPEKDSSGVATLLICTVGDDQKAPAEIRSARFASGTPIPVVGAGLLGPVALKTGEVIRMEIVLKEPLRVAMEISAHET